MSDKSVVIFTSFWDADTVIDSGFLLYHNEKDQKTYRINIVKPSVNYSIHSIALSHPDLSKKPNMIGMNRIDCFCPTYDLLKRYKDNKDWVSYQKDFTNLIKKRKTVIKEWADSIKPNYVYFLCCWENTSHGAHCHREILYKAFSESKIMTQKIIPIYRHGEKVIKAVHPEAAYYLPLDNNPVYPLFEYENVRGRIDRQRIIPREPADDSDF